MRQRLLSPDILTTGGCIKKNGIETCWECSHENWLGIGSTMALVMITWGLLNIKWWLVMIKLGFCLLYRLYTFIYPVYYGLCHLCPKSPAFPGFFTFFSGVGGRGRSPLIFAHRNFCTQKLLHRSLCTEASLHEVKSWNWKKFFRKNPSQELSGTHLLPKKNLFPTNMFRKT